MDEYQLEIQSIRRTLARLREERADADLIDQYEHELRNLSALYEAACETLAAGDTDRRLRTALEQLGYGPWELCNVYSFIYDAAMEADLGGGSVAQLVRQTDYATSLLAALPDG